MPSCFHNDLNKIQAQLFQICIFSKIFICDNCGKTFTKLIDDDKDFIYNYEKLWHKRDEDAIRKKLIDMFNN